MKYDIIIVIDMGGVIYGSGKREQRKVKTGFT